MELGEEEGLEPKEEEVSELEGEVVAQYHHGDTIVMKLVIWYMLHPHLLGLLIVSKPHLRVWYLIEHVDSGFMGIMVTHHDCVLCTRITLQYQL